MYGFAYTASFPCICFGKKAYYFKLMWSKVKKRFLWYSWCSTTDAVWWQRVNSYPFRFFGFFVLPNENVYDLDE